MPAAEGYDVRSRDLRELSEYGTTRITNKSMTVIIHDARDINGGGMHFKLHYTSIFANIFDAFRAASCQSCRDASAIRFKLDGTRVKDHDSPLSLRQQPLMPPFGPKLQTGMKKIHVLFKDPNGKVTLMPVTSTAPLKYSKAWYAEEVEDDVKVLHFFFEGEAVGDEETAGDLDMRDGSDWRSPCI
ncbi:hypothetical protein EJ03DRAFT_375507 [Teratosphaeria nubilosa]|uniref:Uncharacterized protein n=1 Tax=Teratosphaeria nubilosa TaxID=161662 RepID=A0A6G1L6R2_9PEZI|nr:hypothetical protein EJ03DRAFT_375507 [Teratosphaeria nubilosa]